MDIAVFYQSHQQVGGDYYDFIELSEDEFCLIGIFTYIVHGFLNNFLDTDKITAPFYGMAAILVVMDLYQKKKYSETELKQQLEKLEA